MAHKKAAGTTKNGRDSNPKYLGVKVADGGKVQIGSIIVRQRGSNTLPGSNVKMGKDYTLYSLKDGTVQMKNSRKIHFDGKIMVKKVASVV